MKNKQPLVISRTDLTDAQINDLARTLIGIATEFYKDPRNERAFQEWLKEREKHKPDNPK